jgi:ATP-dependent metalloprotease
MGEYVKALVRLDRLDSSRLMATLQRGAEGSYAGAAAAAARGGGGAPWYAMAPGMGGGGGGAGAGGGLPPGMAAAFGTAGAAGGDDAGGVGTQRNPLVITHAEPSVMSQVLRLLRSLALAFILVTAVGAFLDEKSLTKGMMSNPDLKPQVETSTK